MKSASDTTPEAARVWANTFRLMPMSRKWRLLDETFAMAKALHAAGVRLTDARASAGAIHRAWMRTHLGIEVSEEGAMGPTVGRMAIMREVLGVFARLDIAYALGGSMASSIHGIARFTLDADVTAAPFPGKEAAFAGSFGTDYYVSLPAIQEAVAQRTTFNVIHTREGFKVDVFVRKDDAFEKSALERRLQVTMPDAPEQPISVLTAEDVILFKLRWYRLGQEVAGQQLDDVAGIFQAKPGQLDEGYLTRWAEFLQVHDLLQRVRGQLH